MNYKFLQQTADVMEQFIEIHGGRRGFVNLVWDSENAEFIATIIAHAPDGTVQMILNDSEFPIWPTIWDIWRDLFEWEQSLQD